MAARPGGRADIAACACAAVRFARHRCASRPIEDPEVTTLNLDGEIRDGRHHMQIRVYYEDTDFS
ncbi:MAG TPA: hypothetical protein VM910_36400, partial [Bradyrhizobium sp.]|nr:hypothetical protein [Bradyrhizobium sp.]